MSTATDLLTPALSYLAAGLCVLPAVPAKKLPRLGSWKPYRDRRPTPVELNAWSPFDGICVLTGAVSGNLEMIDFDGEGELYEAWRQNVASLSTDILDKLLIEQSPSGGYHVVYHAEGTIDGNQKLAQRALHVDTAEPITIYHKSYKPRRQPDGSHQVVITLIETRGEGGLFLCAPTPGYKLLQGSFDAIPMLSASDRNLLLQAARMLNEHTTEVQPHKAPAAQSTAMMPGDDFNARADVATILSGHGWTLVGNDGVNEKWRRPGKNDGHSATFHTQKRVFYCFSSSADLPSDKGLSPFGLYAHLDHAGDYSRAAAALRGQGYGSKSDAQPAADLSGIIGGVNSVTPDEPPRKRQSADPGPFPADLLTVPGLIGKTIEYTLSHAIYPQPVLALAGAIALQATLAGRKIRDRYDNRTSLLIIGTGGSTAGKEAARKTNRKVLAAAGLQHMATCEDLASDAALIQVMRSQPTSLIQLDEIGRFMRTTTNAEKNPYLYGVNTVFMRLYTQCSDLFSGRSYADDEKDTSIDQPNVVLYGTTVPKPLYESLTADSLTDGFVGRLLIFEGDGVGRNPYPEMKDPPAELVEAARWWGSFTPPGNDLNLIHPEPLCVYTTPSAAEIFDKLWQRADSERAESDNVSAIWGRTVEKAMRLALVYAASANRENPVIDVQAANWACKVSEYLTRRMIWLAGQWISDGAQDAVQKRIIRALERAGGTMTKRQLLHAIRTYSTRQLTEAVYRLCETGEIDAAGASEKNLPPVLTIT